jgi:hypothetical protein
MNPTDNRRYQKSNIKRFCWMLLLGIVMLLLNAPTSGLAQQGGISVGDTVEIISGQGLRLRTEPGLNSTVITTLQYKTQMTVVGGPRVNVDGLTWWELEGGNQRGWAAENYLKVVNGVANPSSVSDSSGCELFNTAHNWINLFIPFP